MAQLGKNLPAMQETQEMQVPIPGLRRLPGEGMATHSCILAWKIPWTEEPGGLQSIGYSQRVRHIHSRSRITLWVNAKQVESKILFWSLSSSTQPPIYPLLLSHLVLAPSVKMCNYVFRTADYLCIGNIISVPWFQVSIIQEYLCKFSSKIHLWWIVRES